jgi:periplasmic protein TonB
MDYSYYLHLITKHTAMTNKEILKADLLDIIFENRNKVYGAYSIRRGYNNRMLIALGAGMSVILLLIFINGFSGKEESTFVVPVDKKEITVREVEILKEKPKELVKPKEVIKQKTVAPKVAAVKFTTPPIIKEDNKVKDKMVAISDMTDKKIGDKPVEGVKDIGTVKLLEKPVIPSGTGTGTEPKQPDFIIQEREPEFPGGAEALKRFLGKNLNTPDELSAGERKIVQIKFKIDKDGSVTSFEIVTSGGGDFDQEVVRVCKKMPKWTPAIQNGINVPVSYVLPVTFIGLEE